MLRTKIALTLLAALPLTAGCSDLEAQEFEREIHSLVHDIASELEETREALEGTLDEETREKLQSLKLRIEETAVRLGERHLDDVRAFLAEDSVERFLDGLEQSGARSWDEMRDDLESGAGQLRGLLDRWADEIDARAADLGPGAPEVPGEPEHRAPLRVEGDRGPFDA